MPNSYSLLIAKLDEFINKYYYNALIRGIIVFFASLLVLFLCLVVIEYFGHFNTSVRTSLFYSFLSIGAFLLYRYVLINAFHLFKLGKSLSHEEAAKIIGTHFDEIKDKLLNALQLGKQQSLQSHSTGLLIAGIDQKISQLNPLPFSKAIDFNTTKKFARYAIIPIGIFLIVLFSAPSIISDGASRLVLHQTHFEKPAPFHFILQNTDLEIAKNDDLTIEVKIEGAALPSLVYVTLNENKFRMEKKEADIYHYTFKNLQKDFEFSFFGDGFSSKYYDVKVVPKPLIVKISAELSYPAYTLKKPETLHNVGDLVVPEGTGIKWNLSTKDVDEMIVLFNNEQVKNPTSSKSNFSFSESAKINSVYSLIPRNKSFSKADTIQYSIQVIKDQHPGISLIEKADSINTKRMYFRGEIKDDYGFEKLLFYYKKKGEAQLHSLLIPINKQTTIESFYHSWDLSSIEIKAGDEIEYYFEVWDNDRVNGSKATKSQTRLFKAPSIDELKEKDEQSKSEIKADLKKSLDEARKLQKEIEKLSQKLIEKKNINWEDKQQVKSLIDKHQQLEENINKIKRENEKNNLQNSEYKEVDPAILEKQKQLEELFEKVMSEEMKQMFEELEKMLDKLNKDKLKEKLDEMKLTNEDIEKELDRSLELFKQLEFEQNLRENIDKAKELSEKQEKLSEESLDKNKDAEELKQKQEELSKEFDELKKDMDKLKEKNEELENSHELPDTKEKEESIKEEMKNSSDKLQQKQKNKASESQKKSAEELKELSDMLENFLKDMQQEQQEEDMDQLRQILENLINLSFEQEELLLKTQPLKRNDPLFVNLAQEQKKLKDNAKIIEDSLFALSKRVVQIEATVNREINLINDNMDKSLFHLAERQAPQAASRQQYAMTSINNLALLLDEIVQQMQQQMAQQKFGENSCSKPGSGKPGMSDMKSMQDALNKQLEKMRKQMEKDGGPQQGGKTPGGTGGNSEQIAKLAAQQAAIRNEIQKMMNQLSKDKEGKESGNQLNEISKLMEKTEEELVNRRLSIETIKRQEEIMSRLLEHEKAEREREQDTKRENKTADEIQKDKNLLLKEYLSLKQKETEMLKTIPPGLNNFYKTKVTEYFNSME
jgi:hypothetical protein